MITDVSLVRPRVPRRQRKLALEFWGGECGLTIEALDCDDSAIRIYDHNPYGAEDGGVEYDRVLFTRPASNVVQYQIDSWGLNFFHQPALSPLSRNIRPAHIINSYAIYHETKSGHCIGGVNYRAGKACHLYRALARDANGWQVWCEQILESDGILSIAIPQAFLDACIYPVIVDPTFGYTSIGGSATNVTAAYNVAFGPHVAPEAGSVQSIAFYSNANTLGINFTFGIYGDTAGVPNALLGVSAGAAGANMDWMTLNLSSPASVSGGTSYWFAENHDNDAGSWAVFDAVSGFSERYKALAYSAGSLASPYGTEDGNIADEKFSVYATYVTTTPSRRRGSFLAMVQ